MDFLPGAIVAPLEPRLSPLVSTLQSPWPGQEEDVMLDATYFFTAEKKDIMVVDIRAPILIEKMRIFLLSRKS